jgi:hypothetical protein
LVVSATTGLLILILLSACATGGNRPSRGKASAVAARAADDGTTSREESRTRTKTDHQSADVTNPVTRQDSYGDTWEDEEEESSFLFNLIAGLFSGGDDDASARQGGEAKASAETRTRIDRPNLLLGYSQGNPAGDAIGSLSTVSISYSFYQAKRTRLLFGLYGGAGTKGSQPLIQEGIDRLSEFGVDVGARSYLTPRHTLAGVYVLFGVRLGGLFWHYTNRTQDQVAGADGPTSDTVSAVTPYLGVGCSVVQVKALHFGASVSYGARISGGRTLEEYENDLFPTVEELRWTLDLSVFF